MAEWPSWNADRNGHLGMPWDTGFVVDKFSFSPVAQREVSCGGRPEERGTPDGAVITGEFVAGLVWS